MGHCSNRILSTCWIRHPHHQDLRGQVQDCDWQNAYIETLVDVDFEPERLRSNGLLSNREVGACRTALGGLPRITAFWCDPTASDPITLGFQVKIL